MRSMQWQLGILGTISAFAYRHRENKKNLCRGGRSQDLPNNDFQPAVRHLPHLILGMPKYLSENISFKCDQFLFLLSFFLSHALASQYNNLSYCVIQKDLHFFSSLRTLQPNIPFVFQTSSNTSQFLIHCRQLILTLQSPVVISCTTSLTFINSTLCPTQCIMCFVWISEQTAVISLQGIN